MLGAYLSLDILQKKHTNFSCFANPAIFSKALKKSKPRRGVLFRVSPPPLEFNLAEQQAPPQASVQKGRKKNHPPLLAPSRHHCLHSPLFKDILISTSVRVVGGSDGVFGHPLIEKLFPRTYGFSPSSSLNRHHFFLELGGTEESCVWVPLGGS